MKANVGRFDRSFRLSLGLVIVIVGALQGAWWGLLGLIPLATAVLRFCPLYPLVGLNTCSREESEKAE